MSAKFLIRRQSNDAIEVAKQLKLQRLVHLILQNIPKETYLAINNFNERSVSFQF